MPGSPSRPKFTNSLSHCPVIWLVIFLKIFPVTFVSWPAFTTEATFRCSSRWSRVTFWGQLPSLHSAAAAATTAIAATPRLQKVAMVSQGLATPAEPTDSNCRSTLKKSKEHKQALEMNKIQFSWICNIKCKRMRYIYIYICVCVYIYIIYIYMYIVCVCTLCPLLLYIIVHYKLSWIIMMSSQALSVSSCMASMACVAATLEGPRSWMWWKKWDFIWNIIYIYIYMKYIWNYAITGEISLESVDNYGEFWWILCWILCG